MKPVFKGPRDDDDKLERVEKNGSIFRMISNEWPVKLSNVKWFRIRSREANWAINSQICWHFAFKIEHSKKAQLLRVRVRSLATADF